MSMDMITYKEADEILGVSVRTIRRYVAAGTLPAWESRGQRFVRRQRVIEVRDHQNKFRPVV